MPVQVVVHTVPSWLSRGGLCQKNCNFAARSRLCSCLCSCVRVRVRVRVFLDSWPCFVLTIYRISFIFGHRCTVLYRVLCMLWSLCQMTSMFNAGNLYYKLGHWLAAQRLFEDAEVASDFRWTAQRYRRYIASVIY